MKLGLAPLALAVALLTSLSPITGCSRDDAPAERDRVASGESIYSSMCKGCHGARGEGGRGPTLRDMDRKYDESGLVRFIDEKMPLGEPERCDGTCPEDVGAYVFRTFRGPIVCDAPVPMARGLRMLTSREYRATVQELLGTAVPSCPTVAGGPTTLDPTASFPPDTRPEGFPFDDHGPGWFAYLLAQLAARPEGSGTMLDNSIVLLCSEISDGNTHSHDDMPFILGGEGGGALRTGRLFDFGGRRHSDLLGTIAHAMGDKTMQTYGQGGQGLLPGVLA
jgi:Cytochrome C oxidase, cbb3-type, subunit III/Protein of unknown function (DUF1587)